MFYTAGLGSSLCQEWIVYFSSSILFHFHVENKTIHLPMDVLDENVDVKREDTKTGARGFL